MTGCVFLPPPSKIGRKMTYWFLDHSQTNWRSPVEFAFEEVSRSCRFSFSPCSEPPLSSIEYAARSFSKFAPTYRKRWLWSFCPESNFWPQEIVAGLVGQVWWPLWWKGLTKKLSPQEAGSTSHYFPLFEIVLNQIWASKLKAGRSPIRRIGISHRSPSSPLILSLIPILIFWRVFFSYELNSFNHDYIIVIPRLVASQVGHHFNVHPPSFATFSFHVRLHWFSSLFTHTQIFNQ